VTRCRVERQSRQEHQPPLGVVLPGYHGCTAVEERGGELEILLAVALMAVFFLPRELLPSPPSWLNRIVDSDEQPSAVPDRSSAALELTMQGGLFTRADIQSRLEALTEELARLDRDPDVFAKAFHTMVAREAYQALLVDVATLIDEPCPYVGQCLDLELVGPSAALWEELEL
jgi:hypothetical protein